MHNKLFAAAIGSAALFLITPATAAAQSGMAMAPTGAELYGQAVRVETATGWNTLNFDQNGTLRIAGPSGQELAQGRWSVENQMMCVALASGQRECVPYQRAFQAGQTVSLTSDCGSASQWTALSVNQMAPPPQQGRAGERG
jgi:hypothetical protein